MHAANEGISNLQHNQTQMRKQINRKQGIKRAKINSSNGIFRCKLLYNNANSNY